MDFKKIIDGLPEGTWEKLNHYYKYAYLKTFIPLTGDSSYGMALRDLRDYIDLCEISHKDVSLSSQEKQKYHTCQTGKLS